jgi:outer membrane receptor for ferrienterochelin and colicins
MQHRPAIAFVAVVGLLASCIAAGPHAAAAPRSDVTLTGCVFSSADGSPISGAEVLAEGTESKALTDAQGRYLLTCLSPGTQTLHASAAGFESSSSQVSITGREVSLDFHLRPVSMHLETMVVTATRTEKTLKEVPILTEVISRQDMESSGAITAMDALDDLPCVEFSPDQHGANILMNGLGPRYVLFLLDGERIAGEVRGNIDFSRLNSASIERIEVVKGPTSSLYGSSAIGGVVNIITRRVHNPLEIDLHSRFSEFQESVLGGSVGVKRRWLTSRTEITHKRSDGYDLDPQTVRQTVEEYEDVSLGQRFIITPTGKLALTVGGNYYEHERFDATREVTGKHPKSYSRSYNAVAEYRLADSLHLNASWHADNYETRDVLERLGDEERTSYEHDRETGRVAASFGWRDRHQLTVGGEYDRESLFSTRIENLRRTVDDWILYVQDDLTIGKRWNVVVGCRLDDHSAYGTHLSPKVSGLLRVWPFNLRATCGSGFRAPSLKDLYLDWDHGGGGPYVYGNSDLAPETSRQGSFSVEFLSPTFEGSVSAFRNDLRDMIAVVQAVNQPNTYYYENVEEAMTQGIEARAKIALVRGLNLSCGYVYLDTEDKTRRSGLYGRPRNTATVRLNYANAGLGLSINLRGKIVGEKLIGEDVDQETGEGIEYYQDAHNLWDLTINQDIFDDATVTIGVDNLFDQVDRKYLQTPGRTFYGGMRVRYARRTPDR